MKEQSEGSAQVIQAVSGISESVGDVDRMAGNTKNQISDLNNVIGRFKV